MQRPLLGPRLLWAVLAVSAAAGAHGAAARAAAGNNGDGADRPTAAEGQAEAAGAERESWRPPQPPAAAERIAERADMVQEQIARPGDGREPVTSPAVLDAMRAVPRHVFVPEGQSARAYQDSPLPIGEGQTISQPYIVAAMTELLELEPGARVLEIGTGSGYQAAVLAHLTPHVYSIEILEPLVERARRVLADQRYAGVQLRQADGYFGWAEAGPFDAVIVTCAAGHLPPPLWAQLKPGGRIVIPVGGRYEVQRLLVVRKTETGERRSRTVMAVRFVPMVGRIGGSN